MHVVLLSHEYPPFIFGGIGSFVENLALALSKLGARVTVVAGRPTFYPMMRTVSVSDSENSRIRIVRFAYPNIPPRHLVFQLFNLKRLHNIIKNITPDVIHAQSGAAFPAMVGLQRIAPVVVTFHSNPKMLRMMTAHSLFKGGTPSDFFTYVVGYPVWMYGYKKEFARADAAVAVSKTLMEEMKCDFQEKRNGEFLYLHNGVDIEKLREHSSTLYDAEDSAPTIIFGGRLYWTKGVLSLLKLAHLLRKRQNFNWKIMIYGNGPLRAKIEKEISDYGLDNVKVFGLVDRAEFISAMRKATFVVFPSLNEACPMVLLEAMCLGKVPVMFDLPYALEFTANGKYGILARNIEEMAKLIDSTYADVDIENFGSEIKDFAVTKYNILNVASEYMNIYKGLEK